MAQYEWCAGPHGNFPGPSTLTMQSLSDAEYVEATAITEAQALADNLLIQRITVASDCKIVVDIIKSGKHPHIMELSCGK